MSLADFSTQAELFSTAGLSASMFAPTDRYRLFAKLVYPRLVATRATLEKCYCLENGREALEPVLMLGASILEYLDGVPDRQAVEMLHYHAGWNFALNRQLGDPVFHPTSLANFRDRLHENKQSALGFTTILEALEAAGLVARQSRQRPDSTQMFGRVAKMSRLDCVRESLRLALKELEEGLPAEARPGFWVGLWQRYVESQVDYRVSAETLGRKLAEAGTDAWQLLEWLGQQAEASRAPSGPQVELLRRVFAEQFDLRPGEATPATKENVVAPASGGPAAVEAPAGTAATISVPREANSVPSASSSPVAPPSQQAELLKAGVAEPAPAPAQASGASDPNLSASGQPKDCPAQSQPAASGAEVQSENKKPWASDRVQPPHEQDATHAATGQGEQTKEQAPPAAKEIIVAPASGGPAAAEAPAGTAATIRVPPEVDSVPCASSSPVAPPNPPAELLRAGTTEPAPVPAQASSAPDPSLPASGQPSDPSLESPPAASGLEVQPKDKKQLASDRVQNPHEPEATYAAKGQGDHWKEHVGYKIQVAETVCEATLAPGEPTRNFIVGIVTHPAYESDEAGAAKMEAEQAAMGLDKPPVQYVDGAYISAQKLVEAAAAGLELIGPAPPPATNNEGRFTSDLFRVEVEQRRATCPAGHQNTQCSRLEEQATKRVSFRFEWDTPTCAACPLRGQCIKGTHQHRTLVVGEHHTALQTRRQEQRTEPFKQRMKHRNGIEGTQSELVRGHGVRHARYRGLAKTKLQNYFTAAACNVKRWLRRAAWEMGQEAVAKPSLAAKAN